MEATSLAARGTFFSYFPADVDGFRACRNADHIASNSALCKIRVGRESNAKRAPPVMARNMTPRENAITKLTYTLTASSRPMGNLLG